MSNLVAIPVYNEAETVEAVLSALRKYHQGHILFIDDGSEDCSPCLLNKYASDSITVIQHSENKGYGKALRTAFSFAIDNQFDALVTMDADWQHEPSYVPKLFSELADCDVVSGSRYLNPSLAYDNAPADRKQINHSITEEINRHTDFQITDAFCGFKGYCVNSLKKLQLTEDGYAMPLQFWIQAHVFKLRVKEIGVPRIYSDPKRQFAGPIKDPEIRLQYYKRILDLEVEKWGV